ncbi:MAG: hypothetical protein ACRDRZ_03315 [Pseudonocardiaceae bacterium]
MTVEFHGDEQVIASREDLTAALLGQMERNWERGDNAANDDLVVQICDVIRLRQEAAACDDPAVTPCERHPRT